METVRKKHRIISRAITITKIKLEKVSNPSQLEKVARGSGKMAMARKTIGSRSHAIELLTDILLFLSETMISSNKSIVAITISI